MGAGVRRYNGAEVPDGEANESGGVGAGGAGAERAGGLVPRSHIHSRYPSAVETTAGRARSRPAPTDTSRVREGGLRAFVAVVSTAGGQKDPSCPPASPSRPRRFTTRRSR